MDSKLDAIQDNRLAICTHWSTIKCLDHLLRVAFLYDPEIYSNAKLSPIMCEENDSLNVEGGSWRALRRDWDLCVTSDSSDVFFNWLRFHLSILLIRAIYCRSEVRAVENTFNGPNATHQGRSPEVLSSTPGPFEWAHSSPYDQSIHILWMLGFWSFVVFSVWSCTFGYLQKLIRVRCRLLGNKVLKTWN